MKTSEFLRFWLQIPPHQNFLDPPLICSMPFVMSENCKMQDCSEKESNGLKRIFANKENGEKKFQAPLYCLKKQRWSCRGLIMKFLALALALKPQVLKNCAVLGSRTALFFESLKFFLENARNLAENLRKPHLSLCPWSLALASRRSVLGLEIFLCSWPRALCSRLHLCQVVLILQ